MKLIPVLLVAVVVFVAAYEVFAEEGELDKATKQKPVSQMTEEELLAICNRPKYNADLKRCQSCCYRLGRVYSVKEFGYGDCKCLFFD